MAKMFKVNNGNAGGATATNWKATEIELYSNTGQTAVRIDKIMGQISYDHNATAAIYIGAVISLSDFAGGDWATSIDGTSDPTSSIETALNTWKDFIWVTDFRKVGTGADENFLNMIEIDVGTKRLIEPNQKVLLHLLVMSSGEDLSAKNLNYLSDFNLWFSPAAQ